MDRETAESAVALIKGGHLDLAEKVVAGKLSKLNTAKVVGVLRKAGFPAAVRRPKLGKYKTGVRVTKQNPFMVGVNLEDWGNEYDQNDDPSDRREYDAMWKKVLDTLEKHFDFRMGFGSSARKGDEARKEAERNGAIMVVDPVK